MQLREVLLTSIVLDVQVPHFDEHEYSFAIEFESTWVASEDSGMYISFPEYSFQATDKEGDAESLRAEITYFCTAASMQPTSGDISDEVRAQLRAHAEPVLLHYFVRDLNDLLTRSGYPPIHFSGISAVLKNTESD